MGRLRQKGQAGAAKAYITRSQAIKKLQCTLADFRRLCILKGIFPREPRSKKKANKGSTAPTSFYYAKDIAYLAHEPVLRKLREHKAFAKKLSRALGRGEWSSAKSLEEQKPVYRLDHIIKERYPTFIDAIRDIDDALCLMHVFANLPTHPRIPAALIESCARLAAEWQLYVMRTHSLRKVFLSIKGVYYQAEVMGELVTWIVPYQFTQTIPSDVDIRVMLTFLELYQTLLGFVFFKLYADSGLVYPPPVDIKKDAAAAGVGAYTLQEVTSVIQPPESPIAKVKKVEVNGKVVSGKDVKKTIKSLAGASDGVPPDVEERTLFDPVLDTSPLQEEFEVQASTKNTDSNATAPLATLHTIVTLPCSSPTNLFAPYTFYLSRESPRFILEFIIRSFGGKVGWPETVGGGSPFGEEDDSITHVVIDRPVVAQTKEGEEPAVAWRPSTEKERRRKYVQPQWVCDCVNAGRLLLEEPYGRGQVLPPHLSPFGEGSGAYDPKYEPARTAQGVESDEEDLLDETKSEESLAEDDDMDDSLELPVAVPEQRNAPADSPTVSSPQASTKKKPKKSKLSSALLTAAASTTDSDLLRKAELEAERAGLEPGVFEAQLKKVAKASKAAGKTANPLIGQGDEGTGVASGADNPNKMLMSNKQRKLYEKMKYSQRKQEQNRVGLQKKKDALVKKKERVARS